MENKISSPFLRDFRIDRDYPHAAVVIDRILKPVKPLNPISGEMTRRLSDGPELEKILKNITEQYKQVNMLKAKKINDLTSSITISFGVGAGGGWGLGAGDNPLSKVIMATGGCICGMYAGILANRPVEKITRTALDIFTKRKQQRDINNFLRSEGIRA